MLYMDLSTFFPKLDRQVVRYAELFNGLPQEVCDLVALIYVRRGDQPRRLCGMPLRQRCRALARVSPRLGGVG